MNVKVLRGVKLRNTQTFGKQDPYCRLKLGGRTRKTRVCENGHKDPVWNQTLGFVGAGVGDVTVEVWNENSLSDSIIGVGVAKR